ncbi:hypothetical protein EHI43_33725 [Rhizobium leguminosarum]|nr:hypothetical protein EHI43_33725 [Rhizobium leguminosarum]
MSSQTPVGVVKNYGTAVGLTRGPEEVCVYDKTAHKPLKSLMCSGDRPATMFGADQQTIAHFASACALIAKGLMMETFCLFQTADSHQTRIVIGSEGGDTSMGVPG